MPAAEGMSGIWMDISGDMPGDHAEAMILKKEAFQILESFFLFTLLY